jgi:hypothetical protein
MEEKCHTMYRTVCKEPEVWKEEDWKEEEEWNDDWKSKKMAKKWAKKGKRSVDHEEKEEESGDEDHEHEFESPVATGMELIAATKKEIMKWLKTGEVSGDKGPECYQVPEKRCTAAPLLEDGSSKKDKTTSPAGKSTEGHETCVVRYTTICPASDWVENMKAVPSQKVKRDLTALKDLKKSLLGLKKGSKTKDDCWQEPEQVCEKVPSEVCKDVQSCKTVPVKRCKSVPVQSCWTIPFQQCKNVPRQECTKVPKESCKKVRIFFLFRIGDHRVQTYSTLQTKLSLYISLNIILASTEEL